MGLRRFTTMAPALLTSLMCIADPTSELEQGLTAFQARDYETARNALKPFALNGNPEALYAMGTMYQVGAGVELDDARAENLYRKAAVRGHAAANFQLGIIYLGVDNEEAEVWLNRAHQLGHPQADYVLNNLFDGEYSDMC